ncbi:MAG: nucleotidyltransferase family protein [Oscillospiraceae bacterium]|jgi:predicted nucleotidyltransferase|nr:nucleotidyltransferase family protein [Oscillospiraceae bacterium]
MVILKSNKSVYWILEKVLLRQYNLPKGANYMKTAAIICEYNPFHNGHKYHIERTKSEFGATHIVAVMSGNFTQRGDVAVFDKFTRAKFALEHGVDLVLELPVAASLGSAEDFSAGAVSILNSLNCTDLLSFGSECGDIDLLKETAGAVVFASQTDEFLGMMRRGTTYPAALSKTIEKYYEDIIPKTLASPNNTLAIEYIKALADTGSKIEPVTIKRYGAAHDSAQAVAPKNISNMFGSYFSLQEDRQEQELSTASASLLRKMITDGENVSVFTPCAFPQEYACLSRLETAVLYCLRSMSALEIGKAPNVLHGLENRIHKAARAARNLSELMLFIKTKRYTLARLRRIVLCCLLGITKTDAKQKPQYIRILGMNEKGREILSKANSNLPMDASLAALMKKSDSCRKQGLLELHCSDIYALAFKKARPCGLELTTKPVIV